MSGLKTGRTEKSRRIGTVNYPGTAQQIDRDTRTHLFNELDHQS